MNILGSRFKVTRDENGLGGDCRKWTVKGGPNGLNEDIYIIS